MKKTIYILSFVAIMFNIQCNKMKNKINPANPYIESKVDRFYWETINDDIQSIPLIKPYQLLRSNGSSEWYLPTKSQDTFTFKNGQEIKLYSFSSISYCNIFTPYIIGVDEEIIDKDNFLIKPRIYFIINSDNNKLESFENDATFYQRLKDLKIPEAFSTPDDLFEQYKNDPVLPWFPEDIKKQLEEVKAKKKN